jgi:hypothetical protein
MPMENNPRKKYWQHIEKVILEIIAIFQVIQGIL